MGKLCAVHFWILSLLGCCFPAFSLFAQDQSLKQNTRQFSNNYNFSDDLYESNPGQLELLWRARMYGESTSLESQSAQVGGADIFAEGKYQLLENMGARLFLRGKFESGRSQSFFGDIEPANGIFIRESSIKLDPIPVASLKLGVLNQDDLDMALFTFRQSFPGGSAKLFYNEFENLKFGYMYQYLIPTSQTLSSQTVDREPTPSLQTNTLYINYDKDNKYSLFTSANTFVYDRLPSFVAFESQKTGNNFEFINGPNNSVFTYQFKGWFTNTGGSYRFNSFYKAGGSYGIIKNEEAPETYNDGQIITVWNRFSLKDFSIYIAYENYFAESDVVPSYYSSWIYGNTNKKGNGGEIALEFEKQNFRIRAQYYDANVINPNGLQQDQKFFYIGVETGYGKI